MIHDNASLADRMRLTFALVGLGLCALIETVWQAVFVRWWEWRRR